MGAPGNARGSSVTAGDNHDNGSTISAAQSVTDQDDIASLTSKFKELRREN